MRTWFQQGGRYGNLGVTKPDQVLWRSSCSERVLESAQRLFEGFGITPVLRKYEDEDPEDHPDRHMRQWKIGSYEKDIKKLPLSEAFQQKAKEESAFIGALRKAFRLPDTYPDGAVLFGATYIKEMHECELYRPSSEECRFAPNEKWDQHDSVWRSFFPAPMLNKAADLARWCWSRRFFDDGMPQQTARYLFDEVFVDTFAALEAGEEIAPAVIMTAHDYTILALLAAAGLRAYPKEVVSFCSYLVVEFYECDGGADYARLLLNPSPFMGVEQGDGGVPEEKASREYLCNEISLEHPDVQANHWVLEQLRLYQA